MARMKLKAQSLTTDRHGAEESTTETGRSSRKVPDAFEMNLVQHTWKFHLLIEVAALK